MTTPSFAAHITNPFGFLGDQSYLDAAFGDIDNDGDLDLFTNGLDGITKYYQNTGSATAPIFAAPVSNPFGLPDIGLIATITLADLNNDGKLDVFLQSYVGNGDINYFQNTGTTNSPAFGAGVVIASTGDGFAATPTFGDIDNDGDLDLFVGHDDGNFRYFENTGTASAPTFAAAVINPFGLTDAGDITKPTLGDVDNDGDLDLLVGETKNGNLNYFENIGTASAPAFAPLKTNPFGLVSGSYPEPNLVDIDGDGNLDVIDAQIEGQLRFFRNTTFAAPTNLAVSPSSVAENSAIGTVIGSFTTTDLTFGDSFTYTLVNSASFPDNAAFTISGNQLKVNAAFDFETDNSYTIKVRTTDQTDSFFEKEFTITVTDVNEAPTAVELTNAMTAIAENSDTTTRIKVANIAITDDALGTNNLSLSGADAAIFEIQGTELFIKAGTVLDFETQSNFSLTVEVDDPSVGDTPDATTDFTLTLTDVNEAPTAVELTNAMTAIAENSDTTTRIKVANIAITDDALGTNNLSLSGADAAIFEIQGTELFIKAGTVLDFETQSNFSLTVEVDDPSVGDTPDATTDFALTITNVNDAPTVALNNRLTFLEENTDTTNRLKVADISITDDALGTNSLGLSGADAAVFEIIGTELFIKAGTNLDFETNPVLDVIVEVDDPTIGTTPDNGALFSLTLTNVSEIDGNNSGNFLFGTRQKDLMQGLGGNDILFGNGGNDTAYGGQGLDYLDGGIGDDILLGGEGNDTALGGFGNDVLIGGVGADQLSGGLGGDQFVYNALDEAGDFIYDFNPIQDKLVLTELFKSIGYTGHNPIADGLLRFTSVQFSPTQPGTLVQVDPNGLTDGLNYTTLTSLLGVFPTSFSLGTNVII
jgi:Ca2+-binding RTX toxin-like protein